VIWQDDYVNEEMVMAYFNIPSQYSRGTEEMSWL